MNAQERDKRRARLPRIQYPPALPIVARRGEIVAAIRKHPVVVITGETGSGKSTQIPKMCLEAGRGLHGLIGCTQPRRIAATTVARRIAEELGEEIGRSVGYKIRFDDRTPAGAFLKVMTDGILLMEAQSDPLLRAYDTLIVDEAHERSLNIDFILGILKNILRRRRNLRVVITSATIDTEKFSRAFDDAPIIEVSGRLFPVEVRYDPPDRDLEEKGEVTHIDAAVRAVLELTARRQPGDILIFMPTERDIRETRELLAGRVGDQVAILPLFSRLTRSEQERVFRPLPLRKIVIATNVAETSLTIPGIRYVIDTGLARIAQYNPRSRTAGLPIRAISRSSADQRKGRCGRVEHGICIRLFSEEAYTGRPLYTPPEILRANLAGVILRMLSLRLGDIDSFPFIDPPAPKSVRDGIDILLELGAIEREPDESRRKREPWRLTERGRIMARLPIDPRIARMILAAKEEGCLPEILIIASALSVPDPRERPAEKEAQADQMHALFKDPASDFVSLLKIWERCRETGESAGSHNRVRRFCRDHFLSYRRIREWGDVHDQLLTVLAEQKFLSGKAAATRKAGVELYAAIHRSILAGYLGHIAVRKEKNLYTATQGRQAMIFPGSGLFNRAGNWIVAAEMVETSRLFARTVANIESGWLEELGGDLCRRTYSAPHWEKNRGEVVATEQVTLFGLVIVPGRSVSFGRIDPAEASRIFVGSALVEGEVSRPLPFLDHNRALVEKIAGMEEKVRRHDLLIGEEEMACFYEARLPGVCDIRTLQRMIRDRGSDAFLRMTEEDLLAKSPDTEEISLFPESVSTSGFHLDLVYRFDPGKPEDGVTLKIPVQAAPSVPAAALDWAVPGMLREKITALLKGLPKEYRKRLLPLAGTCDIILREMPREGSLLTALGRFLYERFGVNIPAERWPVEALEEHLKLRFSVVDVKDRELASGRNPAILERGFADQEETKAFANARKTWEKSGITAWDFGDLPAQIPIRDGIHAPPAFPALVSDESGVGLRLFRVAGEAFCSHRKGVRALLALRFHDELRHLRKTVAPAGDLKVWAAAFGGVKPLENALQEKVMADLFEADVRTEADFVRHAEQTRPHILPRGVAALKLAGPPLKALYDASERLRVLEGANRKNAPLLAFLEGLREEMKRLLPTDFLIRYDADRLVHIGRYLRALAVRAERGAVHLQKALERGEEIRELEAWRESTQSALPVHASPDKRKALEDFGWMVEEYKVSLFAQELKTAIPISRKRIEALRAEIERML
ncbi:MAG: ATP-dependent RNA helicase HrpA [Deltaproteobacteria bacterium]|nr:ATP-dependent RNA helicase HrpA [Deltaproteobacteria bacterium]